MQTIHINNTDINFIDSGDKSAPVIVFSNSLGSDLRIWDGVVAHFKNDFRIILYDKRGHGGSSISDNSDNSCSIQDLSDDLAKLLDHLKVSEAIICGISVGGMTAQSLIASRPDLVKALVLCDTSPTIGTEEFWQDRIDTIKRSGLSSISRSIIDRWFSQDFKSNRPEEINDCNEMLNNTSEQGYIAVCEAIMNANLTQDCKNINLPTLCIVGDEDISTPPELVEKMSLSIDGSKYKIIKGTGHLPCIEKPDILAKCMTQFFKENNFV